MNSSGRLALAFGAFLLAALLLTSGLRRRSFAEVLGGVTSGRPEGGAPIALTSSPGAGSSSLGQLRGALHEIAASYGWGPAEVKAWEGVIEHESSGSTTAVNSTTGAFGIGQINPENAANPRAPRPGSTASQYPGYDSPNARVQLEVMARYIHNDYGTPARALASEHTRGYY